MFILGIIFGCAMAIGLAYSIIGGILYKLNDNGNSIGRFYDFSNEPLSVITRRDKIRKSDYE